MIDGVKVKKLVTHCDDRGFFREIWRKDDESLERVLQTSYTRTNPGVIKAFHWHKIQNETWFVATGMVRVVLYDRREDSPTYKKTQVIFAGEENPVLIFIPKEVAHGYQVLGNESITLFYHTTEMYNPENPDEQRIPFDDSEINFDWSVKNR